MSALIVSNGDLHVEVSYEVPTYAPKMYCTVVRIGSTSTKLITSTDDTNAAIGWLLGVMSATRVVAPVDDVALRCSM